MPATDMQLKSEPSGGKVVLGGMEDLENASFFILLKVLKALDRIYPSSEGLT